MADIIYYQLGTKGLEQLAIASKSIRRHEPSLNIVLYSDQSSQKIENSGADIDELRVWQDPTLREDQASYGSGEFGVIMHEKIRIVLDALTKTKSWILYSDVDIVACHTFADEIKESLQWKPMIISSEGNKLTPLNFCMGLFAVKPCKETTLIIESWKNFHADKLELDRTYHDQFAFNDFFHLEKENIPHISTFPQGYAMPGWMFPLLAPIRTTRVQPRFFHSNWVIGHEEKIKRMKAVESSFNSNQDWLAFVRGIATYIQIALRHNRPPLFRNRPRQTNRTNTT